MEIEKEYNGNWVCMINCKKSKHHAIIGGEVIAVDKDREVVIDAWATKPQGITFYRYVGSLPEGSGGYSA